MLLDVDRVPICCDNEKFLSLGDSDTYLDLGDEDDRCERDVRDERGFRVDVCDLDCVLLRLRAGGSSSLLTTIKSGV